MKFAVLLVVIAGAGIGLLLPRADRAAEPSAAVEVIATPQSKAPPAHPVWRRETVLTRAGNGHFSTSAEVNGHPVTFVVDTGATAVALTIADAEAAGIAVDRNRFEPVGTGAGGVLRGQRIGIRTLSVEGKQATELNGVVIDGLTVSLLGQSYLRTLESVEVSGDTMTLR